jgi:dTDP-4-amino-4,6-dideoxygalactose transaminase
MMSLAVSSRSTVSPQDTLVPFTDLSVQWREIEAQALPDIHRLFQDSTFCLGPFVERFEQAVGDYLGVPHAIGVNSGTSALHLALITAGIGPGDKVLIPSLTFVATAWAALYVGATPVFCDVEDASANIDLADAERRLDSAVKAIIPVHRHGICRPPRADRDRGRGAGHRRAFRRALCWHIRLMRLL